MEEETTESAFDDDRVLLCNVDGVSLKFIVFLTQPLRCAGQTEIKKTFILIGFALIASLHAYL